MSLLLLLRLVDEHVGRWQRELTASDRVRLMLAVSKDPRVRRVFVPLRDANGRDLPTWVVIEAIAALVKSGSAREIRSLRGMRRVTGVGRDEWYAVATILVVSEDRLRLALTDAVALVGSAVWANQAA